MECGCEHALSSFRITLDLALAYEDGDSCPVDSRRCGGMAGPMFAPSIRRWICSGMSGPLAIYLSICLSVYLSIFLSIYLFIYLSICSDFMAEILLRIPAPFFGRAHWQAGVDGVQLVHLTQQGLLNLAVDSEEHVKCLPHPQGFEIHVDALVPRPVNALPGWFSGPLNCLFTNLSILRLDHVAVLRIQLVSQIVVGCCCWSKNMSPSFSFK